MKDEWLVTCMVIIGCMFAAAWFVGWWVYAFSQYMIPIRDIING